MSHSCPRPSPSDQPRRGALVLDAGIAPRLRVIVVVLAAPGATPATAAPPASTSSGAPVTPEQTCDPALLAVRLADRATLEMAFSPPDPSVHRGYWGAAEDLGCARVVTSTDGRLRIWTTELETLSEEDGSVLRGEAWLQWAEGTGAAVARADPALHLDTMVDMVLPVPGRTDAWLVAGLRAYRAKFVGDLPRRFLQVVQVGAQPARLPGALRVGGRAVDQVLLYTSGASTGKFRHHPFASSWFTVRDGAVWLTPVPDGNPPTLPTVRVASWTGSAWDIDDLPPALTILPDWESAAPAEREATP